jgi:hypothetical protein
MVKSRRRASSSTVPHSLSWVMSGSSSAVIGVVRKVLVSMIFGPKNTCASLKRRPMMRQLRNALRMVSGVALVATSKSFGLRLRNRSRTQPPTR